MLRQCTSLVLLAAVLSACAIPGTGTHSVATDQLLVSPAVQRDYDAAVAALSAGQHKAALRQFEHFVQAYPHSPGAWVNLALVQLTLEQPESALLSVERAVAIDGDYAPALNQLGVIKRQQGDFAAAEQAWLRATEVHPEYAYAWYNLGVLYDLYLQDLPAALEHYQRYQDLSGSAGRDETVARWIADIENRLGSPPQTAQARRDG